MSSASGALSKHLLVVKLLVLVVTFKSLAAPKIFITENQHTAIALVKVSCNSTLPKRIWNPMICGIRRNSVKLLPFVMFIFISWFHPVSFMIFRHHEPLWKWQVCIDLNKYTIFTLEIIQSYNIIGQGLSNKRSVALLCRALTEICCCNHSFEVKIIIICTVVLQVQHVRCVYVTFLH